MPTREHLDWSKIPPGFRDQFAIDPKEERCGLDRVVPLCVDDGDFLLWSPGTLIESKRAACA